MIGGRVSRFILAKPALSIAIGVSAAMGAGLLGVWLATHSIANDFGVYWRTANSPIQWAYWPHWHYPFPYMPTMILWTEPLQLISLWPAFFLFIGLSAWALVLSCRPYLSRAEMGLLLISPPFTNGLMTGQVSILMAALMLWACGASNRFMAGIAFGIVATIKPQLVVMAPLLFLLQRDWRAILGSFMAFASVVALTIPNYGVGIWLTWYEALGGFRERLNDMLIINVGVTPASAAESWGLPPLPFLILGASLGAWLVYRCRNMGPVETAAAVGLGSILAAPYALTYDLVVVAPFLVLAVFRNRVTGAFALSGVLPPVPVLLAAWELKNGLGRQIPETAVVAEGAHRGSGIGIHPVRDLV